MSSNLSTDCGHGIAAAADRKSASHGGEAAASASASAAPEPSRTGPSTSRQAHPKPGQRILKGEDVLAKFKLLGYNPPKHQQRPEQYDYLFQDKDTVAFMQRFASTIGAENVVDKDEMTAIQKMVDENRALYGEELEALVEKSRKERQDKIDQAVKKDQELQDLKLQIQRRKESIEKLKQLEERFAVDQEKKAGERALVVYQTQQIEKDCQRIQNELHSEENEQGHRAEADPAAIIQNQLQELEIPPVIVSEIAEQGVELEDAVRDRMKVKVDVESDLLKQSMTPFEITKRFEQYGKDLERLKHCIIHEIIQQIQNRCLKEVNEVLSEKLPNLKKENERAVKLAEDVRSKMVMEKREAIDRLKSSIQQLMDNKLKQIRRNLLKRCQEEIHQIQLQKYESRKQIQSHFKIFADVLLQQFANLLICNGLVQLKNERTLEFVSCLKNFCQSAEELKMERHYLQSPIDEGNLAPEHQAVARLFKTHGISLEILRSPEVTKRALSLVHRRARQVTEAEEQAKEKVVDQEVNNLFERSRELSKQWEDSLPAREKWDADWKHVGTLQENILRTEQETKVHFLNQEKEVKETIKEKEALLVHMKEFLQDFRSRSEQAVKAEAELRSGNNRRRSSMFGLSFDLGASTAS